MDHFKCFKSSLFLKQKTFNLVPQNSSGRKLCTSETPTPQNSISPQSTFFLFSFLCPYYFVNNLHYFQSKIRNYYAGKLSNWHPSCKFLGPQCCKLNFFELNSLIFCLFIWPQIQSSILFHFLSSTHQNSVITVVL